MQDLGKDWAYRMAATVVIDLMVERPDLDQGHVIDIAWITFKQMEIDGHGARYQSEHYRDAIVSAIRDIGAGLKERMEHPGAKRAARSKLGIA